MDPKLLKTFITVANHSSFTGAAKELYIAQSAVSKHINQLEKELGVQLLLRDTRMVQLTAAGKQFYRDSVDIMKRMDEAVLRLSGRSSGSSGVLKVGVFSVLAEEIVEIMRRFVSAYPGVEVTFEWYEFGELIRMTEAGEIDVAFTIGFAANGKTHLRRKTIEKGRMSVLLGKNSPLANRETLSLSELEKMKYYAMQPNVTPDGYVNIMTYLTQNGVCPQMIQCSSHESMIMELQLHDDGYGLMGEYQYRSHPGVVFVPLAEEEQPAGDNFDLVAMWRADNENPCIGRLLEGLPYSAGE